MTAVTVHPEWTRVRIAAMAIAALVLTAGLCLFSTRAWAILVSVPENGTPGHLSLKSDPYPAQFLDMSPGDVRYQQISADLVDPTAPLTMQFTRQGALVSRPDGLQVRAQLCDAEWTGIPAAPACSTGATNVFGPVAASDIATFGAQSANHTGPLTVPVWNLGTITDAHDEYLLVTMSIPDTPAARTDSSLMGITADLGFGFNAHGDDGGVIPPPGDDPGSLAPTGVDALTLALLALGALGIGVVAWSAHRVRDREQGGRA